MDLAQVGAPPKLVPLGNTAAYVFSNPFRGDSEGTLASPSAPQEHAIGEIRRDKPLFIDSATGFSRTWDQVRQDALRVGAGLRAIGLEPCPSSQATSPSKSAIPPPLVSPIVLLHLPNCVGFPALLFGVFSAGLTATMANPALTSGELAWILHNSRPVAVVTTAEGLQTLRKAVDESGHKRIFDDDRVFVVDLADSYSSRQPTSGRSWTDLLAAKPLDRPFAFASPEEARSRTAVVLWSSGTSGKSKGVLLSHSNLNASLLSCWRRSVLYGPDERWLGLVPFFHIFGLGNVLCLSVCIGATVVVVPRFDPRQMLELVQRHRITYLHIAPPVAVLLAKSPMLDGFDLSSVKGAVSGGAPLALHLIEEVNRRLGIVIAIGYGLSEAGAVAHQTPGPWESLKPQLGSTGTAVDGVEIKIVSLGDEKQTLRGGEEGEIVIRSPAVMSCYLNNPAATAEALDEQGWFYTGDIGRIDGLGQIWITDRLKEVIKVRGFQVSPSDLEAIICTSPKVADAAVTGVYDDRAGTEVPRAYVVPADPSLVARCAGQDAPSGELVELGMAIEKLVEDKAAHYKRLRGNIVFIEQVPKSPAGKILRRLLKDAKGVEVEVYPAERPKAKL